MVFPSISIINFVMLFYLGTKLSTLPLKNVSTKTFSYFFFTVSVLALIEFLIYKSTSFREAMFWAYYTSAWPLVLAFYFHFIITLTDITGKLYRAVIIINYVTASTVVVLFILYIKNYMPLYSVGGYALESPVMYQFPYILIGIWNTVLFVTAFLVLIQKLRNTPKGVAGRKQASWILTAMTVYLIISLLSVVLIRLFNIKMPEPVTFSYFVFGIIIFIGLRRGTIFFLESDKTAKKLIESKNELVVFTDTEDRTLLINSAFHEVFQISITELRDTNFTDFLRKTVTIVDTTVGSWTELPPDFSNIVVKTNGMSFEKFIRLSRSKVERGSGIILGCIYTGVEITRLKQVQRDLVALLEEKEVLLNEIYHRVKNNMQIIISLFNLKVGSIDDPEVGRHITDVRQMIMTLNQIQQKIYESPSVSVIESDPFFREICLEVYYNHKADIGSVQFSFACSNVPLPGDFALIVGLLTGELLAFLFTENRPAASYTELSVKFSVDEDECTLLLEWAPTEIANAPSKHRELLVHDSRNQFISLLIDMIDGTVISGGSKSSVKVRFPYVSG